jgi:thiamine biosynthesis lipoprotein
VHADRVIHVEHVWGTAITLNVAGTSGRDAQARRAIDECARYFAHIDAIFSTYHPETEVALYRNGIDRPGLQSTEFEAVLKACTELRAATGGSFDPWAVPGGFDPSGYVRGWAIGRASQILLAHRFTDHLINAGGDICSHGSEKPDSGEGWPTGIVNPHEPTEIIAVVNLLDQSMATSGRYERGNHVIDPATGSPAIGVDSATVVGPDPGIADALASAALVDGLAAMTWFVDFGPEWSLHLVIGEASHTHGAAFD